MYVYACESAYTYVYMYMREDMYKIKILSFPKINQPMLKETRRQGKKRQKNFENRAKK